jgi:HEAT repeat protein
MVLQATRIAIVGLAFVVLKSGAPDEIDSASQLPPGALKKLHSPDPQVRVAAAESLGRRGPKAASAAGALCTAALDPVDTVRAAALSALAKVDPPLHASVSKVLKEADPERCLAAIRAIGDMKEKGKAALPILLFVEHLREVLVPERTPGIGPTAHGSEGQRLPSPVAAGAARAVAASGLAGFKTLTETMLSVASDDKLVTQQLAAWMLAARNTEKRRFLAEAIIRTKHRADAVPALIAACRSEPEANVGTQVALIRALGAIGPAAKKAAPLLERARRYPSPEVREAAADALDMIKGQP